MSCDDHLSLVNIIRGVHQELRRHYQENKCNEDNVNGDLTWKEHCTKDVVLQRYATAMQKLAVTHWKQNNTSTRIDWCHRAIKSYYHEGGLQSQLERDVRIEKSINKNVKVSSSEKVKKVAEIRLPLLLLDVGSCFNPFKDCEGILAFGIDLCPATNDVYRCDFLNLDVTTQSNVGDAMSKELPFRREHLPSSPSSCIKSLPGNSFHAVVFSLLLEYLPCSQQRLRACIKARDLLFDDGLLLIVTPDSKHESYNSRMIRSWRVALGSLGLIRVSYEKQKHLHCMAFRKLPPHVACNRREFANVTSEALTAMFYIPQDFHDYLKLDENIDEDADCEEKGDDDESVKSKFLELPCGY